MTKELILLGTGYAMATACYNTCFAIRNGEEYLLVDAGGGNGILMQLEKANIDMEQIRSLFVTHSHTDHILGAIWVVRSVATKMNKGEYIGDFSIYGNDVVVHNLIAFCQMTLPSKFTKLFGERIRFNIIEDGEQCETVGLALTFFDIDSTKAKQFGCSIEFPTRERLVCLGDEPCSERTKERVVGCDWLLSEAFCLYADRNRFKPYEKNHTTALDAAQLASELSVRNLVLYHTEDTNLNERKQQYSAEAAEAFSGVIFVPNDLERITL